jgi:hypothetical protein
MKTSILTKNQKKIVTKNINYEGKEATLEIEIRFDDECDNGHNSFFITGSLYRKGERPNPEICGCIHDEIIEHCPELAYLIPFHGMHSDSPMHYVDNTIYHASDKDCYGRRKGDVTQFETSVYFNDSPVRYKIKKPLLELIQAVKSGDLDPNTLNVQEVPYSGKDDYDFSPKYHIIPCEDWYKAPFDNKTDAEELLLALKTCTIEIRTVPTAFSEGKKPNFDHARACAHWPEVTDAQLSLPEEELREILIARIPELQKELAEAVESIGFTF